MECLIRLYLTDLDKITCTLKSRVGIFNLRFTIFMKYYNPFFGIKQKPTITDFTRIYFYKNKNPSKTNIENEIKPNSTNLFPIFSIKES